MSLPRRVETFKVKGPFGVRVVGLASGVFLVENVDGFLEKLAAVDREEGTVTQAVDASHVAGAEHLVHAARLAIIANENKTGFAGSLAIELICWTAAERQISRAFEKMGVRSGSVVLAIVSVGTSSEQVRGAVSKIFRNSAAGWDNSLMELKREKIPELQKVFSISQAEITVAPIQKIILERVALLALAK
ncbi:MAG: KEOPS complex subunit Cgi121 [Methanobacteriota archaeon]